MSEMKYNNPYYDISITEIPLELFKLKKRVSFRPLDPLGNFAMEPRITSEIQEAAHLCAIGISQSVFGIQVQKREIRYPKDWFQAFKERWFPEWAKDRWPVEYEVISIDVKEFYPSIKAPEFQSHFSVRFFDKHNQDVGVVG